ncbi:polyketide cyclase [Leucobacter zeae]|nr:polyketide cyclase [Leucobacter zeae]
MVDVTKQIASVERALRTTGDDGGELQVQTLAQTYPAGIDDVWSATTTAERIARWFLPVEGDLEPGGRYQFAGNAGGEILACSPPRDGAAEYRATWEMGGGVTWITVRLTSEAEDRTRFELEHSARTADLPPGFWETYGPGATGVGWDGGLLGLSLHLGAVAGSLSPDEAAAWATTDEGKAFYRGAADGWAEAHAAAGADREAAARAADATYGFYTGAAPAA